MADLANHAHAMIAGGGVTDVQTVRPLTAPAFDVGATERQLREDCRARFNAMQDAWLQEHG